MACGIYLITCTATGDRYIGQSKNLEARIAHHWCWLNRGTHLNALIKDLCKQHSPSNFCIEVLEECEEGQLKQREYIWMIRVRPSLNRLVPALDASEDEEPKLSQSLLLKKEIKEIKQRTSDIGIRFGSN